MKKIVTLVASLFFASLCWGQYGKTETTVPTDLTSYLPSTDAWKTLPSPGGCTSLEAVSNGGLMCKGFDNYQYQRLLGEKVWTKLTALGTQMHSVVVNNGITYALGPGGLDWAVCQTFGPTSYSILVWNGTAWIGRHGCLTQLSVASDGTLVGVNTLLDTQKSVDGGVTWTQISGHAVGPNLNYVSASTSSVMCGTLGAQVFTLVSGHFTLLAHMPANSDTGVSGCAIAGTSMYAWGPSLVYVQSYNFSTSTWSYVAGGNRTSLTMAGKYLVFALGASGVPQHLNILVPYHSSTISGSWTNGCGGPCPPNGVHTATNRSYYPHGLAGNSAVSSGAPGDNLIATSFDFTGSCDPLMGDPSDPECQVADVGTVHCSILGSDIFTEANPFQCFLNAVPPNLKFDFPLPHPARGWLSGGGPVLVYINSNDYANGSLGYTAICNGIKSWAPGNQKTYTCLSNNGVPSPEPTSNYIYVSKGGNRSSTDACGPTPYYNCPSGHIISHSWMQIDNTATTSQQIQGNAAHEEGHNNFMDDCGATCKDHGSVMGSGSTNAANQKTAATPCDLFWYLYYAILWGGPV